MILKERISKLNPIVQLYSQNNMKYCIQQIHQCNDNFVLIDLFDLLRLDPLQKKVKAEDIVILLENVIVLLNSKYSYQIIKGLEFIKFCFNQFKDNILKNKSPKKQQQNKAQDKNLIRPKIQETMILQFDKIVKLPKLNTLLKGKDTKLVNLISQIKTEISLFLNKLE